MVLKSTTIMPPSVSAVSMKLTHTYSKFTHNPSLEESTESLRCLMLRNGMYCKHALHSSPRPGSVYIQPDSHPTTDRLLWRRYCAPDIATITAYADDKKRLTLGCAPNSVQTGCTWSISKLTDPSGKNSTLARSHTNTSGGWVLTGWHWVRSDRCCTADTRLSAQSAFAARGKPIRVKTWYLAVHV